MTSTLDQKPLLALYTYPHPGSVEAGLRGCTCPVIDNHHGKGVQTSEGKIFWLTEGCPLHCQTEKGTPHD